ncbi:ferric reductase like transmembrane component-domain-containing protein [Spinellus fusiger]|nr:ferric reductase like transmembrane component-domain-containing protein [Spinellus fusiger]
MLVPNTASQFHIMAYPYAMLCWGVFSIYCILNQASRLYTYWIRKQRIHGHEKDLIVMPWTRFLNPLERLIEIPLVTGPVPIKHVLGIIFFMGVNVIFLIFSPFVYTSDGFAMAPINILDRRAAYLGMVNWDFVILLGTRNTILSHMAGLSYEELLPFHRWLARIGLAEFVLHFVWRMMDAYSKSYIISDTLFYDFEHTMGSCALFSFLIMFIFSINYIRRNYFELFYYTHIIAFMSAMVFVCLHETMCFFYFIPVMVLWIVDRLYRSYRSWFSGVTAISVKQALPQTATHDGITRALFEHSSLSSYRPGQYVFLSIVNKTHKLWPLQFLNWHPFTISEIFRGGKSDKDSIDFKITEKGLSVKDSYKYKNVDSLFEIEKASEDASDLRDLRRRSPAIGYRGKDEPVLASVHIKGLGNYTHGLLKSVAANEQLSVKVDGPYGARLEYQDHKTMAIFALGIGVTPALALIKDCAERRAAGVKTVATENIYFVWTVRVPEEISVFIDFIAYWNDKSKTAILPFTLNVFVYVTRVNSGDNLLEQYPNAELTYGKRPDIPAIMQRIENEEKQYSTQPTNVFVHACGTSDFMCLIHNTALKHHWMAHTETFEF